MTGCSSDAAADRNESKRDDHTLPYARAPAKTNSESIETTVRRRRIFCCWLRGAHGKVAAALEDDV